MSADEFFGNGNSVFIDLHSDYTINDLAEHNFGDYTIVGCIHLMGSVDQKNVYSELYFNITTMQHFLVKIYPSNKIHIDFFIQADDFHIFTMSDENKRIEAFTQDGSKELGFHRPKNCYYVTSFFNGRKHTLFFNRELKNV